MSHPLYNPYASGTKSSTQGQHGLLSIQSERDPPHLGSGSNFNSSGGPSATPANSGGIQSSLMSQPVSYRSEQRRVIMDMDKDIERSIDMHISRAREEVRLLDILMHQLLDQDTADSSKFYSPSSLSDYASSYSRFNTSNERERVSQSILGLGARDYQVPEKSAAPTESSRPKYTSESAANMLLHFGLEKEDLEHLTCYPEDQITPANLPFILRQIRIQKSRRTATAVQSKPYPEPQHTRSFSGVGSHSLSSSGGTMMHQEQMSSTVLQPNKVIDYGHTGRYAGMVGEQTGQTSGSRVNSGGSGSMSLMDSYDSSCHSREPLQKNTMEVKSSALGSSLDQATSATGRSSLYSSVLSSVTPASKDSTNRLQTQPHQTSKTNASSFNLATKDTNLRLLKPEASRSVPFKEQETAHQSAFKAQPPSSLTRGIHPSRPDTSGTKNQNKTQGQLSVVAEQMKKQLISQPGPVMWPPVLSAGKPVTATPLVPSITDASQAMQQTVFIPVNARPTVIPPAMPPPVLGLINLTRMMQPSSSTQTPAKVAVFKGLPTLAMMHDYAASSPRIFPHTCCLCKKECTHMKDWISHQNTTLHLENCRIVRIQYPEWDGEIALGPSGAGKEAKPSASASAQASQQRHYKSRTRSHSRSPSPRCQHGSESRREKRSSRSPHSSRYYHRSCSLSPHYRSCSRSPDRRLSMQRRDEKRSSPKRNEERWSSPRRRDERLPPRRTDQRRSPPRRGVERRSPQRKRHDSRSPTESLSPQPTSSSSATRLAKKLLETSAAKSLSEQSDLETVVKTLAPALLAELVKMKSSPSSSSSSKGRIPSSSPTSAGQKRPPTSAFSSSFTTKTSKPFKAKPSEQKSEASSSAITKSGKSRPPTMLRLEGISCSLSHKDVITAVERFGKTKSVVLFRTKQEAIVVYDKEEDAKKLRSIKNLNVQGIVITVAKEKETVSTEPNKPPQKKSATSSVSTPQITKFSTTAKVPLTPTLPTPKQPVSSGAKTATRDKPTRQKTTAKGSAKSLRTVNKANILVSKAKNVSTKQKAKTVKPRKLPAKGIVIKTNSSGSIAPANQLLDGEAVVVLEETAEDDKSANGTGTEPSKGTMIEAPKAETAQKTITPVDRLAVVESMATENAEEMALKTINVPSKFTVSENQLGLEHLKPKDSETKVPEAVMVWEQTAEDDKSAKRTDVEPFKGTVAELLKEETAQEAETPVDRLAEVESVATENSEETAPKSESVPSKSTVSKNQLGLEHFKPNDSETKGQEAVVVWEETAEDDKSTSRTGAEPSEGTVIEVPETKVEQAVGVLKETVEVVETADMTDFQPRLQAELDKIPETMELVEPGVEAAEPMQLGSHAKGKGEKNITTQENSDDKLKGNEPPASTVEMQPTEISFKSLQHIQQSTPSEPEETAHGPEKETEASQMQQQAAGSPAETAVEAKLPDGEVKTKILQKDPVNGVKTETDVESDNDASKVVRIVIATSTGMMVCVRTEPTASAVSEDLSTASTPPSTAVAPLTIGEMVEKHLQQNRINLLGLSTCFSSKFFALGKRLMLITRLPVYSDGSYSEGDVVKLLLPFGFQHKEDSLYVVHQACMAFFVMPNIGYVHRIMKISRSGIIFKGSKLCFRVVNNGITMTPLGFYKSLMKLMNSSTVDDGSRTVFIKSISPSEARNLRETLRKIGSVKNYLPLLNKVFIEFESVCDADRLGVWYSLLKRAPCHEVQRLKVPTSSTALFKLPQNALPDSKDLANGTTIPRANHGVPRASASPFWLTMTTIPFLFPTISPWFNIPYHLTVRGKADIEKASRCRYLFSTVMLTGLPVENYKHEDVAKLVWKYFPKQSLQSLYYNVVVLTLQRRAFVFFPDWTACCNFLQDHVRYAFCVVGYDLTAHLVLEHMYPESSEVMMYKSLMKWSNAGVSEPEGLEERLLSVEISETSLDVISVVLEVVMSIATFVSFLPLANRICIEMADCSGLTQVVGKYKTAPSDCYKKRVAWSKVQRFQTLKSLKQRLLDSSGMTINLDSNTPAVKGQTQPPPSERPDIDSQTAAGPADIFNTLTAAIRQYSLAQEGKSQSEKKEDQEYFTGDIEPQSSSSSRQSSRARGERQSSGMSSSEKTRKEILEVSIKKEEADEKPLYQIVDSLENDHEEPAATEVSDRGRKKKSKVKGETRTKEAEKEDTCGSTAVRASEKVLIKEETLYEIVDDLEEVQDESTPKKDSKKEDRSTTKSQSDTATPEEAKKQGGPKEETVEVDVKELVTLDEVGADEAGEMTEGELQALVTLDEFVEEEEEEKEKEEEQKAEQRAPETRPLSQDDESGDSLNPETLVTLDEAGGDEEEKPDEERAEKSSRSAKRKHEDNTEEMMNFVTVDEVGEVEEEEELTTRTGGQAKKRTRQTPVRKSTRGKTVTTKDEREEEEKESSGADVPPPASLYAASSSDKDPSTLSNDGRLDVQKAEEEAASRVDQMLEESVEEGEEEDGRSRTDIKAVSKLRRELIGPEAKRSRSQSPCVAADFKLPPFKPNNPLGQEFVVPKSGFFCNLCSAFYLNESAAKELHCSSQRHYDNLKKHYQRLEQKPSTSSTQSSGGSVSD